MTGRLNWSLWGLVGLLSAGLAVFSYRYLPRIGPMSPDILRNLFQRPRLDIHVAGAATALRVGPFQFLGRLRAARRAVHRWLGRIYVAGCLTGGVGGLVMAFGSTATAGFGGLAAIWIVANVQGWRMAAERRFGAHRAWMIRSFAMTFAAVTLRLYLPLFPFLGVSFLDGYRAVSFLSWVPNLILAELYLRGAFARRPSLQPAR